MITCAFRLDKGARELLVAVSFGLAASEVVADRRSSLQMKRWEAYARLCKKVEFLRLCLDYISYFMKCRYFHGRRIIGS